MIINKIGEKLQAENISISDFAIAVSMQYASAWALASQKVGGIKFDTLDKACAFFNCQPGDLLDYVPDRLAATTQEIRE